MNKAFCTECEKYVLFNVKVKHTVPRLIGGKTYISRDFYVCTCAECGAPVTIDEYEKLNCSMYKYRDYTTIASYSKEDEVWYGQIENIRDLVSWESETVDGIEQAFKEAVDDYIEYKKEIESE